MTTWSATTFLGGNDSDIVWVSPEVMELLIEKERGFSPAAGARAEPRSSWRWRIWSWALLGMAGFAVLLGALSDSPGARGRSVVVVALLAGAVAIGWVVRVSATQGGDLARRPGRVPPASFEVERAMTTLSAAPSYLRSFGAPDEVVAQADELLADAEGPARLLDEGRATRADRDHLRRLEAQATAMINQWGHR